MGRTFFPKDPGDGMDEDPKAQTSKNLLPSTRTDAEDAEPVELAQRAVDAAEKLDPATEGAQEVADLQAQVWAELADAFRTADRLAMAEIALSHAFEARQEGTGSPLLQARMAELCASLLCDQRYFAEAFELLDFAHRTYEEHQAGHDAGRVLIEKGMQAGRSGDPEAGIQLIARGLQKIEPGRDPRLAFQALHSILLFRVELGEFKAVRQQIWQMRPLYELQDDRIARLQLRGMEGTVYQGLGEIDRALRALQQARDGFLEEGLNYDAALVAFEIVEIWLGQGKWGDATRLLQEMVDIFSRRSMDRESVASLVLLRDATERGRLTPEALANIAMFFKLLQSSPAGGLRVVDQPQEDPEGG
jgi:tetratricopeptide (TPR) repeat protein